MKRAMDFSLAAFSLFLLLPLYVIVSLVIIYKSGLPMHTKSLRIGLNGRPFYLYKFRLNTFKEGVSSKTKRSVWVKSTGISRILNHYRVEDIPQLFNILRGEMSFVGPHPQTKNYLERCNMEQVRRFHVRPGITGWTQVYGRLAFSREEKNELDVWYVDNRNIMMDFKILWSTFDMMINPQKRMGGLMINRFESVSSPGWKDGYGKMLR